MAVVSNLKAQCISLVSQLKRGVSKMEPCSCTVSSLLFSRVTSPSLEPQKNWYILNKDICGILPSKFAKSDIFKRFPDEIRTVSGREFLPAKSSTLPLFVRTPSTVYTVSTFGLIAGLLRQKEVSRDGLFTSPQFKRVINLIDSTELDFEAHEEESWEARHFHRNSAQLALSPKLAQSPQMKCTNNFFNSSDWFWFFRALLLYPIIARHQLAALLFLLRTLRIPQTWAPRRNNGRFLRSAAK